MTTNTTHDRKTAALLGLFVADAVAMPVHWMYDLGQLRADYGTITGYVAPKDRFRGSIMNLSNTGGGGRGSDEGSVIGDVINHGKKKYWVRGGDHHYHLGLAAGENTLEAQLVRVLLRGVAARGGDVTVPELVEDYVAFMTTPGSHRDTYAATAHRMFFANWSRGVDPLACADNDGHNTDSIDALTLVVPVVAKHADTMDRSELHALCVDVVQAIRKSTVLDAFTRAFVDLLAAALLTDDDLREVIEDIGRTRFGLSVERMVQASGGRDPMVACYIDQSFPAMLHFAWKHADDFEAAVLANANAGGENVARGSLLGALLGARHGLAGFSDWQLDGLHEGDTITREIRGFLTA
ncbi:MAG: ADP-ribosylglycohydrolase family protein [Acidobacteriota bacterium]